MYVCSNAIEEDIRLSRIEIYQTQTIERHEAITQLLSGPPVGQESVDTPESDNSITSSAVSTPKEEDVSLKWDSFAKITEVIIIVIAIL
jgi:hypothetical protein